MVLKVVDATELRIGSNVIIDGEPYTVRSMDSSKTGKHGHAKCRIEAIGILDGKKRVLVVPGHERLEVPMIEKKKCQVLSVLGDKASIMDLESFETLDVKIDEELKEIVKEGEQAEYWQINEERMIKRKL